MKKIDFSKYTDFDCLMALGSLKSTDKAYKIIKAELERREFKF